MSVTNERQTLSEVAEQSGWKRRQLDRTDFYRREGRQVEVFFTADKLNGGTLYADDLHLLTHTRDKEKVESWLNKAL